MPCTTYTDPVCSAAAEAVAVPAVSAAAIASAPPSARVLRRIGAPDRESVDLLPALPTPPPRGMHPFPPSVPRTSPWRAAHAPDAGRPARRAQPHAARRGSPE